MSVENFETLFKKIALDETLVSKEKLIQLLFKENLEETEKEALQKELLKTPIDFLDSLLENFEKREDAKTHRRLIGEILNSLLYYSFDELKELSKNDEQDNFSDEEKQKEKEKIDRTLRSLPTNEFEKLSKNVDIKNLKKKNSTQY